MKRRHLLWGPACAALLLAAPLWAAEAKWEAELRGKLEKEVKADFVGKPLPEALQHLANAAGCKIALDGSVREGGTVTFHTEGMPASKVLGWVCFLTESRWLLDGEMVLVCSHKKATSLIERQRRTYDLAKLAPEARDAEALHEIAGRLLRCIGAASVEAEAGPRLAVTASEAGHACIAKLLDSLPRVPRNGKLVW